MWKIFCEKYDKFEIISIDQEQGSININWKLVVLSTWNPGDEMKLRNYSLQAAQEIAIWRQILDPYDHMLRFLRMYILKKHV